ncbi:hypothetical protein U9M48_000518 [Paspalum notatum var. saurae]|uniref:Retrotransposon gag domain-containing protein n=1 Tax=Paspalum notatum var. saurae TaxID=547442 RepID=A0AAQ3SHH0_PASNO
MDAEDWLRAIERELDVAQCTDQEKVLYGPHQLRGAAQQWWESYRLAHNNPNTITWQEFTERFGAHHVPVRCDVTEERRVPGTHPGHHDRR